MKKEDQHHNSQFDKSKPIRLITTYEQILQEYPDVFESKGKIPGTTIPYQRRSNGNSKTNSLQTNTDPP